MGLPSKRTHAIRAAATSRQHQIESAGPRRRRDSLLKRSGCEAVGDAAALSTPQNASRHHTLDLLFLEIRCRQRSLQSVLLVTMLLKVVLVATSVRALAPRPKPLSSMPIDQETGGYNKEYQAIFDQ